MKVKHLIGRLKRLGEESEIYISCDEEGNHIYRQLSIGSLEAKKTFCMYPNQSREVDLSDKP